MSYKERNERKLWRMKMKMKLFVSFFILLSIVALRQQLQSLRFRTLWRVRSIGVTASHGCYCRCVSFFLSFAFCRIMSFSCKMEMDGRQRQPAKEERTHLMIFGGTQRFTFYTIHHRRRSSIWKIVYYLY